MKIHKLSIHFRDAKSKSPTIIEIIAKRKNFFLPQNPIILPKSNDERKEEKDSTAKIAPIEI